MEVSRIQSWLEFTDPILWGRNGSPGMIQEHRDYQTERRMTLRIVRWGVVAMGILGGVPGLIVILQLFHAIPK